MDDISNTIEHTGYKPTGSDKWSDWVYHAAQALKELSMAEDHLIAELSSNPSDITGTLREILGKIRNIRKQIEKGVTG